MCLPEGQGFKEWWVLKKHHPIGSKCQLFTNLWMRKHSLPILLLPILAHCLLPKLYHGHLLEGLLEILLEKDVLHGKAWQFTMRSSQIILGPLSQDSLCNPVFISMRHEHLQLRHDRENDGIDEEVKRYLALSFFFLYIFYHQNFHGFFLPPEFPCKNVTENIFFYPASL